jgi:hypothetical protein
MTLFRLQLMLGTLGFCLGLGYGIYDVIMDRGFADGLAWLLSGVTFLIDAILIFETPIGVYCFSSVMTALIFFLSFGSIFTHSPAMRLCNQSAYIDLMTVAAEADDGLYGYDFSPSDHQMFRQMVRDCVLQGPADDENIAGQMIDAQSFGPASSVLARSAGILTPPAPQSCQDDYQRVTSVAPYLFAPYQSELVCMTQPKRFWSW